MDSDAPLPEPPRDLPDDVVDALQAHADDPHVVRESVIYAQELLNRLHEDSSEIVPQGDEEILRITERPGYTEVVKRNHPDSEDAYLYFVTREPHPEGDDHLRWRVVGQVDVDEVLEE
ncbi:hypothetical protein [Haloarchaeobius amylolyticus]|uniref:hypothetical protein n=1 Tax=Haloarchaeobius amylolyticus TaxID=1198296 RepID=UPI0022718121|nr:hypothetical protein [Haloarchaeobius amylolyticus]